MLPLAFSLLADSSPGYTPSMTSRRFHPDELSSKDRAAYDSYVATHWGFEPSRVIEVQDPLLPDLLAEMGQLKEISVNPLGVQGGVSRQVVPIRFPGVQDNRLCYCPELERLYPVLTPTTMGKLSSRYTSSKAPWYWLKDVAKHVGGDQCRAGRWAKVKVQVLGPYHEVIYYTAKNGDAEEKRGVDYVHLAGEEGGIRPYLCIDDKGRLWFAGGDYTVPPEGITD